MNLIFLRLLFVRKLASEKIMPLNNLLLDDEPLWDKITEVSFHITYRDVVFLNFDLFETA